MPLTCRIWKIYVFLLTSLYYNCVQLFHYNLLSSARKWKKLIRFTITWIIRFYYLFLFLYFLNLICVGFNINSLSFKFNHKMILLRDSINISIYWFKFCINRFEMNPTQRKKLNFIDSFLCILKFYMYFTFINEKVFI